MNTLGDAAKGIAVSPLEGERSFVVGVDVTHDLASQISLGSKDAPRDQVALNLGKPDFDLVEPGRIGGCVMEGDPGIFFQKESHRLVLCAERLSAMM